MEWTGLLKADWQIPFAVFILMRQERYSWWSYRAGARSKNIGWRIDYFLVSESFLPAVKDAFILEEVTGSDHCPVGIS